MFLFLLEVPKHFLLAVMLGSLIIFSLSILFSVKIMQKKDL